MHNFNKSGLDLVIPQLNGFVKAYFPNSEELKLKLDRLQRCSDYWSKNNLMLATTIADFKNHFKELQVSLEKNRISDAEGESLRVNLIEVITQAVQDMDDAIWKKMEAERAQNKNCVITQETSLSFAPYHAISSEKNKKDRACCLIL